MITVLGHDPAWGGWGTCLATPEGPIACRWVALSGRTWRWAAVAAYLAELRGDLGVEAALRWREGDPDPLTVIEAPSQVNQRGHGAGTGLGLGKLVGAICLDAVRPGWAYPWEVPTTTWRPWWGIKVRAPRGRRRAALKAAAVAQVELMGWGDHLAPFDATGPELGARGDVAEAILVTVGAARHRAGAPAGPRRTAT